MKKKRLLFLIVSVMTVWISGGFAQEKPTKTIEGTWLGALKVSGFDLRIVFRISKKPDGTLSAVMDSPDQGAKDIATSSVILENDRLTIEVKVAGAVFEGNVKPDWNEIEGQWKQGGTTFPLILKRTEKVEELKRPQEPKKPYPYHEEEVSYENKKAGIKLAGTLTLPASPGPYPAVLLITGSGPQDRNEALLGHKPFLVLADYLTRRGIAVLRVDDRGVGGSTGVESESTSLDFAGDVLSGVAYLKSRKEVDPKEIGLIGHSEGGIIAPLAASLAPEEIAFIVMMAGTGLTGEEIIVLQAALIAKAGGASDEEIARSRKTQEATFAVLKQEKDPAAAATKIRELLKDMRQGMTEEQKKAMTPEAQEAQLKMLFTPWFRFFLTYDPKPALMKVKCPVLVLNGEKDLQVPPKENLKAIEGALKAGGNKHYTIKELPGLNHLFQTAQTGSPAEYMKIEETIAPSALAAMSDWILDQTKKK
jgi:fermentation-respiration switch protein FrsA (DUF1100 family)